MKPHDFPYCQKTAQPRSLPCDIRFEKRYSKPVDKGTQGNNMPLFPCMFLSIHIWHISRYALLQPQSFGLLTQVAVVSKSGLNA